MRIAALVLFGIAAAVVSTPGADAAPVPKHLKKEAEGDQAKLQGKWKLTSIALGGKEMGGVAETASMVIEFRGDSLVASSTGQNRTTTATVTHDPKAGTRRFTTTNTQSVQAGNTKAEKDETFAYAFDGDRLLLAVNSGGNGGTVADPLKSGPNDAVLVLTRVK